MPEWRVAFLVCIRHPRGNGCSLFHRLDESPLLLLLGWKCVRGRASNGRDWMLCLWTEETGISHDIELWPHPCLSTKTNIETDVSPSVRATAKVEGRFTHKASSAIVIFFVACVLLDWTTMNPGNQTWMCHNGKVDNWEKLFLITVNRDMIRTSSLRPIFQWNPDAFDHNRFVEFQGGTYELLEIACSVGRNLTWVRSYCRWQCFGGWYSWLNYGFHVRSQEHNSESNTKFEKRRFVKSDWPSLSGGNWWVDTALQPWHFVQQECQCITLLRTLASKCDGYGRNGEWEWEASESDPPALSHCRSRVLRFRVSRIVLRWEVNESSG